MSASWRVHCTAKISSQSRDGKSANWSRQRGLNVVCIWSVPVSSCRRDQSRRRRVKSIWQDTTNRIYLHDSSSSGFSNYRHFWLRMTSCDVFPHEHNEDELWRRHITHPCMDSKLICLHLTCTLFCICWYDLYMYILGQHTFITFGEIVSLYHVYQKTAPQK